MDAYLNELSVKSYGDSGQFNSAYQHFGNIIKLVRGYGVNNIRCTESVKSLEVMSGESFVDACRKNKFGDDLSTVIKLMLYSTIPIPAQDFGDDIENALCDGKECYGLSWASDHVDDTVALSIDSENWNLRAYKIDLTILNEDLSTKEEQTDVKNISKEEHIDAYYQFLIDRNSQPPTGSAILKKMKAGAFLQHLEFSEQAEAQLKAIRHPDIFAAVRKNLLDLERVAALTGAGIPPTDKLFREKATQEFSGRRNLQKLIITFKDGVNRLCDWHLRYTPTEGRVHFCPDLAAHKIYVGYIGLKIL